MVRRSGLVLLLVFVWFSPLLHSEAQSGPPLQAWTHYAQTVYSNSDRSSAIIGVLAPHAEVYLEARSADTAWVLGHSLDGQTRGWVESRFLELAADVQVGSLLISNELIFVPPAASTAYLSVDLNAYPIVPVAFGQAHAIFGLSQIRGKNAHVVSKIGDCISDNEHFLSPFGWGNYTLGNFASLQPVIDHFREALAYDSLAAYNGLVTTAVLDPLFANPIACQPGETPLRCEYRMHNPSVAIIMFGAQDLLFTPADQFNLNLRRIVHETIQAGIIPILSTFPGNTQMWDEAILYNQIVVQIALDYDIPLMNLWRALDNLPNHGLNTDGRHLSLPLTTSGDLTSSNLVRGYPMRNLVTLPALDALWRGVMN